MKLAIFGATGGTGTCLVEQAIAAGHDVTAVVRDPARLAVPAAPALHPVTADLTDPQAVADALAATDAVLTAIGPHGTQPTTIIHDSARAIIAAMQKAGVGRLVMVSGSIVADDGDSLLLRCLVKPVARRTFLRHVCADMRAGESAVRSSGLDWTIVRPPALTSRPARGSYRMATDANPPRAVRIPRGDLAACLLKLVGDPAAVGRHIGS